MAIVHLVSPDLVKRANSLLVKSRRRRVLRIEMHDWVALLDAAQQPGTQPDAGLLERGCEPSKEQTTEHEAQALEAVARALG